MGFEEYLNANYNEKLDDLTKLLINHAFKAGAASRQDEIDDLQKRIDDALRVLEEDAATLIEQTEKIYGILKGEN